MNKYACIFQNITQYMHIFFWGCFKKLISGKGLQTFSLKGTDSIININYSLSIKNLGKLKKEF
jgi:hypothetical protein